MKVFALFFSVVLGLFCSPLWAAPPTPVEPPAIVDRSFLKESPTTSDKAIFRLESEVTFLSDLHQDLIEFLALACSYPDSLLVQSLLPEGKVEMERASHQKTDKQQVPDRKLIMAILNFKKLEIFFKNETVELDKDLFATLKESAEHSRCVKVGDRKALDRLRDQMRLEVLFRKRFSQESFWISQEDLQGIRKNYPGLKDEEILKREKELRKKNGVKLLLDSMETQIHSYLYL